MGLLLLQMGLLLLGLRRAQACSEAAPATALLEELIQDEDGDVCIAAAAAISKATRGY